MVQDGRRSAEEQTDPNPWPISEWTMADQAEINGARSLLLAPALGRPAPMASHTWCCTLRLLEPSARTVWAMCTRVSPWPPLTPVLSVTGDNLAFLVFLPCTHRACGSSPIPNPAALHLRGTQSSKISAARGGSKPAQLHRRFTHQQHTDLPIITNPPLLTTIRHCRLPLLGLVPSFCLLFFFFQNTPPPFSQSPNLWTGWRRDRPHSPNTACLARTTPTTTTTTLLYASPGLRAEVHRPITTAQSDRRCWALGRRGDKERWKGITEARVAEAWCRASCCW